MLKELFPFTFVALIWVVQLCQGFLQTDWSHYSLFPGKIDGIVGIITGPLLHAGWVHLLGNSLPLLVLGYLLFNSYKEISGKVFWVIYILNGVLLWLFARPAFHLGASGLVYGMASFLFFSGIIRKHSQLAVISLLIVFLYGSMVWGVFPFDPHVSWEAHLYGGLTGLVLAFVFRKEGPQAQKYWEDEKDDDAEDVSFEELPSPLKNDSPLEIVYTYKESEKAKEKL